MKKIHLYTWPACPYCIKARNLLKDNGYDFEDTDVLSDPAKKDALTQQTGQRTVPYVFVGDELIGGSSDLEALMANGKFEEMVK